MSEKKNFQLGDVVRLVGTHQRMTVTKRLIVTDQIQCMWFDRDNRLNTYIFPIDLLEYASNENNDDEQIPF